MIKYYKNSRQQPKLKRLGVFAKNSWINVITPNEKELEELSKILHLAKDVLVDATDEFELPRLKYYGNNLVIIVRIPIKKNNTYTTIPFTIIANGSTICTITNKKTKLVDDITNHRIPIITTQQSQFIIQIFTRVIEYYQDYISTIHKRVQKEKAQLETVTKQEVLKMVETEDVLNEFISALNPTIHVFKKILHGKYIDIYEEDRMMVDDLLIDAEQVYQFSTTNLRTVKNIRDGYTTVLSIRLNQIMKVLTYVTAIFTIPMLITSLYGMNVKLPLVNTDYAFGIILVIISIVMVLAITIFIMLRKRI